MKRALLLLVPATACFLLPSTRAEELALVGRASAVGQAAITTAIARLPLWFEKNEGQTDSRVSFLSRGRGYGLFLTPSEMVLAIQETDEPRPAHAEPRGPRPLGRAEKRTRTPLRVKFLGSNTKPEITGVDELPGKSNYFIGNDPKGWRMNVPQYARVFYRSLWKGIDLSFYGTNQGQIEFDFKVSPGADPSAIRLTFEGARKIRLDEMGNLVLEVGAGEVIQNRPLAYQEVGGVRRVLNGSWVLKGKNRVGFRVAGHDPKDPLTIDPVLVYYSTYLGGSGYDQGYAVAADAAGNGYVTGFTNSTDFPPAGTPFQPALGGPYDAFVAKINPTSGLVYSTYLGGGSEEHGFGIAVDALGNAYVAGDTRSANFPTAGPPSQPALGSANTFDAFVTKLSPTSDLVYSTYLGGVGTDYGMGIALDTLGNAYVTGLTESANFPTAGTPSQLANAGGSDAFVTKLGPTSALLYSTYLGGSGGDFGRSIAVDAAGNAYVTGEAGSTNFPIAGTPFQAAYAGGSADAFVAKLSPTSGLAYSTYLGGSNYDAGEGIAVDAAGNAYVTGLTISTNFPTGGTPFQATYAGGFDAFITKLSPSSSLVFSSYLGGSGDDYANGIAVDALGSAYLTGVTSSMNFPTAGSPFQSAYGGSSSDAFVAKVAPTFSLVYSTYLGGGGLDAGASIAVDAAGTAYVTGWTSSSNFPTAGTPFQPAIASPSPDAFLALFRSASDYFTVTPCRLADTRNSVGSSGGPALGANTIRVFPVIGVCNIPLNATAVFINVTLVDETDFGNLRLYPAGSDAPVTSTINFTAGKVRSNNGVVSLGAGGRMAVQCQMPPLSAGWTHFVLDVYGYFE